MKLDQLKDLMKTYGMKPLAEAAGVSRTSLYNLLQGENFESETLEKVSKVLNVEFGLLNKTPSYEEVCNHLAFYGAPLVYDKSKTIQLSLEETLKWGLYYSKSDGLLESVLPYFLLSNFKKLNLAKLFSKFDQENQLQLFGYYLELVGDYSKSKKMKDLAGTLYSANLTEVQMGHEKPSDRMLEVLKHRNNKFSKKWNVLTLSSAEDYFDRFRKWGKVVK